MENDKTMSRRRFLKTVAVSTGVIVSGLDFGGCADDGGVLQVSFDHGVASGDPLPNGVILWTRALPRSSAVFSVEWEVATDEVFNDVIASGWAPTGPEVDYTIKVDVDGLLPATTYFYRFKHAGTLSSVGRTKTLPSGAVTAAVMMAVFSCANYPAGYFHVYAEAAKRDDIDVVLHLGDYLYEYGKDEYASADADNMGRVVEPETELYTLSDYRRRYAQYRSDPDLQALHARTPFIAVWDDHEIANDTYIDGAENHDPLTEGDFAARRAVAIQAYYEWLPIREPDSGDRMRIYRSFDFGDLLTLHMLDARVIGRDKQLDYADYFDPATGAFDSVRFQADLGDPNRQLLGAEQSAWLQSGLASSTATWQVLGQQVLMGRMDMPAPIATQQISFGDYLALAALAQSEPDALTAEQWDLLEQPSIPYNLDAWDGYTMQRESVLGAAREADVNLIVLAGDTHNAWASDLQDYQGAQVGVEFATPGVSSPGLEEYLANDDPAEVAAGSVALIEPLCYADTAHRGYMLLKVSHEEVEAEWIYIDTVKSETYALLPEAGKRLKVLPGTANRRIVEV